MKLISAIFLVAFLAQGFALECYICHDCNDPFDASAFQRQTCSIDNIEGPHAPTTTPDPTTTTTAPEEDTTTTTTTTVEDTTTTTTPEPEVTTTTTEQVPEITTTTTEEVTTPTFPPTTGNPTTANPITVAEEVSPPVVTEAPVVKRQKRQTDLQFRCFVAHSEVNGNRVTRRGCTSLANTEEGTCESLNVEVANCRICNENGCNSATSLATSLFTILAALLITFRIFA